MYIQLHFSTSTRRVMSRGIFSQNTVNMLTVLGLVCSNNTCERKSTHYSKVSHVLDRHNNMVYALQSLFLNVEKWKIGSGRRLSMAMTYFNPLTRRTSVRKKEYDVVSVLPSNSLPPQRKACCLGGR